MVKRTKLLYSVVINLEMSILQAFCELSLSAVLRNTSFVHKLFEDAVQNRGVVVDDVLKQDASLMTYSSLNGKKLFLPTLQNTNVTVK